MVPLINSWTLTLIRDLFPLMTLRSIAQYRRYLVRETDRTLRDGNVLRLQLRRPYNARIRLHETGSDVPTFREVLTGVEVYRCVVDEVPDCRTIVDLGANIGLAAIYFAAHYPGSRILAVEPNPATFADLEHNVARLLREKRVELVHGGVWSAERALAADPAPVTTHSNAFATVAAGNGAERTIPGYPMARLLDIAGFERADLVKVDIEGAELELFRGDLTWLDRVGAIAIEFHRGSREASDFDRLMSEHGFSVHTANRHTVIAKR
jgi:FkbM family methyltransferase